MRNGVGLGVLFCPHDVLQQTSAPGTCSLWLRLQRVRGLLPLLATPYDGRPIHLIAGGRFAEPLHDAFLAQFRLGRQSTRSCALVAGRRSRSHCTNSDVPLVDKWVGWGNASRAMQRLASYHCDRVCGKMIDAMQKVFG